MIAPNLLRVGTPEKIFVECQDCTGADIEVEIRVMNYPTKADTLKSTTVRLTSGNKFQNLGQLTVKVSTLDVHFPCLGLASCVQCIFSVCSDSCSGLQQESKCQAVRLPAGSLPGQCTREDSDGVLPGRLHLHPNRQDPLHAQQQRWDLSSTGRIQQISTWVECKTLLIIHKVWLTQQKMPFSLSVHYRLFAVTPGMEPVERSNSSVAGTSVAIEIVV